jgi:hypothetical protein
MIQSWEGMGLNSEIKGKIRHKNTKKKKNGTVGETHFM